jgi:TIR domain
MQRDLHSALKSEVVSKLNAGHLEVVLAKLQWGKDDIGYGLHVNPTSFSTAGLQTSDFLGYLGFQRSDRCSFTSFQRCYCIWVDEGFTVEDFATAFNGGFGHLDQAQRALEACGFMLPQPEGWGYYYGKPSGRSRRGPEQASGDGHTAMTIRPMKKTEDERFQFSFTFIDTGQDKAFVTHYRPKHLPMSSELGGVFKYLGLQEFQSCPEFDFEPCFFRTLRFVPRDDGFGGGNVEFAHGAFDAHPTRFSPGIESLLAANAAVEAVGMPFLPLVRPAERMRADIETKVVRPVTPAAAKSPVHASKPPASGIPDSFDVAISFAGSEREYAEKLARLLRDAGYAVFYDDFYPEQLWGKNLTVFFDEIFRKKARYCVMFVSKEYQARKWTSHEARSAQARALEEKGNEYILPVRVDDTELEGLLPTTGYVPIGTGIDRIGEILLKKLAS